MATKKTNGKAPAKGQKRSSPSIAARIDRLVDYKNSKVNLSAYGLDEITEFNICCESRGGGAYAIYFVFA